MTKKTWVVKTDDQRLRHMSYLAQKELPYTATDKEGADYRKRITTITVTINPKTEPEIHEKVNEQENKSGYIKSLIERDIKGGDHGC